MGKSVEEWDTKRDRLQNEFIAAALNLREHMGRADFMIPVEDQSLIITVAPVGQPIEENAEDLEQKISEDAAKLYDLKREKYIDIEIDRELATDPCLHVTIGPEASPPDEAEDDARGNKA